LTVYGAICVFALAALMLGASVWPALSEAMKDE
jgi:hypothetical protein